MDNQYKNIKVYFLSEEYRTCPSLKYMDGNVCWLHRMLSPVSHAEYALTGQTDRQTDTDRQTNARLLHYAYR